MSIFESKLNIMSPLTRRQLFPGEGGGKPLTEHKLNLAELGYKPPRLGLNASVVQAGVARSHALALKHEQYLTKWRQRANSFSDVPKGYMAPTVYEPTAPHKPKLSLTDRWNILTGGHKTQGSPRVQRLLRRSSVAERLESVTQTQAVPGGVNGENMTRQAVKDTAPGGKGHGTPTPTPTPAQGEKIGAWMSGLSTGAKVAGGIGVAVLGGIALNAALGHRRRRDE